MSVAAYCGLDAGAAGPLDMADAQEAWRSLPVGTVKIYKVFGGAPGGALSRAAHWSPPGDRPLISRESATTDVCTRETGC